MAAVGSPWITAAFTTLNRRSKFRQARTFAVLFGQQKDHALKLEHGGDQLKNNPREEWLERAEKHRVVQLQE
jgi:hypothetical protein